MKETGIQWCHSTVNPVAGCDGCELWPAPAIVKKAIMIALLNALCDSREADEKIAKMNRSKDLKTEEDVAATVESVIGDNELSWIYTHRLEIAERLTGERKGPRFCAVVDAIRENAVCYAGHLSTMRAGHKGYPGQFETPKLFPGRMAEAAGWGPPSKDEETAKPWLKGCRRIIFISDMGDALSASVLFEYLHEEIIKNVGSEKGRRHIWTWLTKRPGRMAAFAKWLEDRGIAWPKNLMAMTTVTSQETVSRIEQLRRVPAALRGLSIEPLYTPVKLDLSGIDWVIVGGSSGALAKPFHLEWAMDIHEQCKRVGCAFFLKQLGSTAYWRGEEIKLKDRHSGDWSEWTANLRVRNVPSGFLQ